jgi:hypothetical protein
VLIQDINELLSQNNISLCHTLREGNQCVDFFAKLEASSDVDLSTHAFSPNCVRDLFKNDEMRIFFLRISSFFLVFVKKFDRKNIDIQYCYQKNILFLRNQFFIFDQKKSNFI